MSETATKKFHVHISGYTGPTGSGHELGEGFRWADAKLYKVDGSKPMGEQFELIATIEVAGKTARECSEKIAKIAKEKYNVVIDKTFKQTERKYEYLDAPETYMRIKKINVGKYEEVYDFVKRKEVLGHGYIEEQAIEQ